MRKYILILLTLVILSGCHADTAPETDTPDTATRPEETTVEIETADSETDTTAETADTEPDTEAPPEETTNSPLSGSGINGYAMHHRIFGIAP